MRWELVGKAAEVRLSQAREAILRVLRSEERAMSPKEVWEALELEGAKTSYTNSQSELYSGHR